VRYQHASEIRADLKRLKRDTDSERVGAGLAPSPTRATRWRWLAGSLAVILAGLTVGWFVWRRAVNPPQVAERQLTANPFEDSVMGAAISPDGKHIAYNDRTGLYVRSIDSGETHAVTLPEDFKKLVFDLEWFPDGGRLLAMTLRGQDTELWVINLLGEAAPRLLHKNAAWPAISPDGQMIAFARGDGMNLAVWVSGINGEAPRKLATEDRDMVSPAWSPDGLWIAYDSYKETTPDSVSTGIEVRPAGGGPAKTLVSESSLPKASSLCIPAIHCLQWLPDWRLVFSARQAGGLPSSQESYSFWQVPVERRTGEPGGKPERLAQWNDSPQNLAITVDGKRLSFVKSRQWQDVYLGELGPDDASMKPPRRLSLENRGVGSLDAWTPDSQAVFFSSNRSGKTEVFRQDLNEVVGQTVLRGSNEDCCLTLSSDGSWMLYEEWAPSTPSTPHRLMRRPAAGGSPEMVLEEPAGMDWDYACALKPGSRCVVRQFEGKDVVFYSLDPVRGRGEQLGKIQGSTFGFNSFSVSPDGSRLALVRGGDNYKGRIDVLTFRDHTWHEVPLEPVWGFLQSIAWAAGGNGFFVTSNLGYSKNLLHITLDGKAKSLLRYDQSQWMTNPLPSPNGKYLAFEATTWDSNVWMIEGF
jgi:Tol biopolymer transport system component